MKASVVKSDTSSMCTAFTERNTNIGFENFRFANGALLYEEWSGIIDAYFVEHRIWSDMFHWKLAHHWRLGSGRLTLTSDTAVCDESNYFLTSNNVELTGE